MSGKTFEQYVHTYSGMVFRIAFNYFANNQDAEDVMQEVFLKLYQKDPVIKEQEQIKAWLITVTMNHCRSLLRSPGRKRKGELRDFQWEQLQKTPDIADAIVQRDTLYQGVMALPKKYRVVVYLYYYEDYSTKDIAKLLHRRETTIQTQLMRAREKLRNHLETGRKKEEGRHG